MPSSNGSGSVQVVNISKPDAGGDYAADVPSASSLSGVETVQFVFENVKIDMPASAIKALETANGSLKISQGSTNQSTLKTVKLIAGTNKVVTAFNLNLTGFNNNAIHELGQPVKITVQLTDEQLSALKGATPALYYYDPSTGKLVDMNATFDLEALFIFINRKFKNSFKKTKKSDTNSG